MAPLSPTKFEGTWALVKTRTIGGMATPLQAPHWDLSVLFPSLESAEFAAGFEALAASAEALLADCDARNVYGGAPISPDDAAHFEAIWHGGNTFAVDYQAVEAYIYSFVTTDARNEAAQAALGRLEATSSRYAQIHQRFMAWLGGRDMEALKSGSAIAAAHPYLLEKAKTVADHSMTASEEALAADMMTVASNAWERLHGDVTSQISVRVGEREETMPTLRALAYDADRSLRQQAYEAELDAWTRYEIPCAAAMNAIKGQVNLISQRRGWGSPLDESLFHAAMDRRSLDAMIGAAKAAFPDLRRYLRAKAKMVAGQDRLDWFDMFAPVGDSSQAWEWADGSKFVVDQFRTYSDRMADFAQRSYDEGWIDAAPRPAKRDGAFCMGIRPGESRLLQTWKPSFGAVSTLAHELGHAYHNLCLKDRLPLESETPMTLAETASIFCEQIIAQAALKEATGAVRLGLLDQTLQRDVQVVVDITSRFLFETEVFARREKGTLSAREMCEIMTWAQGETYGDGLSEKLHPYMWAVKGHYYSTASYYNFPYMFGLLFSTGLYARYQSNPDAFRAQYDDLLSSTGLASASDLAARFGIDLGTSAFWEGSLRVICEDAIAFESAVNG